MSYTSRSILLTASCALSLSLALLTSARPAAGTAPWMHSDPANKTVQFDITMGAPGGESSGLNFNGYSHGHMTITVPLGWKVSMNVANKDSLPHSLEIAPAQTTPPMDSVGTAFPRAETVDLKMGMPPNKSDSLSFTADKAGRYWMMCAVPGHAAGGMWDWFVVSNTAAVPAVTFEEAH